MLLDPRIENRLIKDESEKKKLNKFLISEMEKYSAEQNVAVPEKQATAIKKSIYSYINLIMIISFV